jgi:hypothetical protein
MVTLNLNDMDIENPGNNSIEDNTFEKVIAAPPKKKSLKKYKDGDAALKTSPVMEKKSAKQEVGRKKKFDKLVTTLAKLEQKQKKVSEKLQVKEKFANDLRTLTDQAQEARISRKNITALKKVLKEIDRDIKKARKENKTGDRILKAEKKLARLKVKQPVA